MPIEEEAGLGQDLVQGNSGSIVCGMFLNGSFLNYNRDKSRDRRRRPHSRTRSRSRDRVYRRGSPDLYKDLIDQDYQMDRDRYHRNDRRSRDRDRDRDRRYEIK